MPHIRTEGGALRRGLACLCCRKRKLKCDGTRPTCRQCMKVDRAEECEYDDHKQNSRTHKLKQKLALLENRLRELESSTCPSHSSSNAISPPPTLTCSTPCADSSSFSFELIPFNLPSYPPHDVQKSSPLLSSHSDPSVYDWSIVETEIAQVSSSDAAALSMNTEEGVNLTTLTPLSNDMTPILHGLMGGQNPMESLPLELRRTFLCVFIQHKHQCWFDGNVGRIETYLLGLSNNPPHPALESAVYLLACHYMHSAPFIEMADVFLGCTLQAISSALHRSDRLVDIVQASSLLGSYFYANGRMLEGYCHSFAAARLAIGLGLHRMRSSDVSVSSQTIPWLLPSIPMDSSQNHSEWTERVSAFWQCFALDRCWSVAFGLPVGLPHGENNKDKIVTPWPTPPDELCQQGLMFSSTFIPALRAKAAAFYEKTFRLAAANKKDDKFWADYHGIKLALDKFSSNLPPFLGIDVWRSQPPFVDVDLFLVHTLTHTSKVHMAGCNGSDREILDAAGFLSLLIQQLSDVDYEYLDPILSACWHLMAQRLIRMTSFNTTSGECVGEDDLSILLAALGKLAQFSPVADQFLRSIQREKEDSHPGN